MRNQLHMQQMIGPVLLGVALCIIAPAHASAKGPWMALTDGNSFESGRTPDRTLHFANASYIRDLTDQTVKIAEITKNPDPKTIETRLKALEVQEMDVIEVYENPKAPGFKQLTMQFQCLQKRYRVVKAEAVERNHLHHFSGETDWQQYTKGDWQSGAYFVACAQEIWKPLVEKDMAAAEKAGVQASQITPNHLKSIQEYGVVVVGVWSSSEGVMKVYRLAWDKVWAGKATPTPFHHNRTAAEEKEYQTWKQKDDAIRAENEKNAPMILSAIAGLEGSVKGELKGLDEEKAFQDEIAGNFKKHKSPYYGTFRGLTEEQVVDVRGAPTSMSTHGNLRLLVYAYVQDTRQEVTIRDGKGNPVGSDVVGQVLRCDVTFKLRVGGNNQQYRVVDYQVKRDITSQGYGQCD